MSWREEINNIFDGSGSEDLMGFMENKLDEYEANIVEYESDIRDYKALNDIAHMRNKDLKERIEDLEKQIEAMKCCDNCHCLFDEDGSNCQGSDEGVCHEWRLNLR